MFNFFKKKKKTPSPSPPPPAASLEGIDLYLKDIPGAIEQAGDDMPRVDWSKVAQAVRPYDDHAAIDLLWTELAAQWLGILGRHFELDDEYRLYEGNHLLMLSADEPQQVTELMNAGDVAWQRLDELVQRTPKERGFGKHAVLVLADQNTYYDYISHYDPGSAETYGTSSGVHISEGYRHTVINGVLRSQEGTLVHELAHTMLCGRGVPVWVDEGLAQWAASTVGFNQGWGGGGPRLDARQTRIVRRYWNGKGVGTFWSGQSFSLATSQRASYQLADVLFRNLLGHPSRRDRLGEFLATATHHDAGDAACRTCFGVPLALLVEEFLGPGPWQPAAPRDRRPSRGDSWPPGASPVPSRPS
ncbi:MAG: hypothetical protein FWE88_03175 [Phycisphaerae bacterium]|nr:hypothetical protein [Phycisphaerae bacterium]